MLVVVWEDVTAAGPWMQLVACVADMGEGRRLAAEADVPVPTKRDRIDRKHPAYSLAVEHPGELLWRVDEDSDHGDGFDGKPWRTGAAAARALRAQDVARYNGIQQAARKRRRNRPR